MHAGLQQELGVAAAECVLFESGEDPAAEALPAGGRGDVHPLDLCGGEAAGPPAPAGQGRSVPQAGDQEQAVRGVELHALGGLGVVGSAVGGQLLLVKGLGEGAGVGGAVPDSGKRPSGVGLQQRGHGVDGAARRGVQCIPVSGGAPPGQRLGGP